MTKDNAVVTTNEHSVTIERVYATSPERLFAACTKPDLVCQWLAPGPMKCNVPIYDVRKGGRFRIEMSGRGPDGSAMSMSYEGTFDEVTPGRKIVMLWPPAMPNVDPDATDPPSVTITLMPVTGGTRLRLTQDGMPNKQGAGHAAYGWESAFEKLAALLRG